MVEKAVNIIILSGVPAEIHSLLTVHVQCLPARLPVSQTDDQPYLPSSQLRRHLSSAISDLLRAIASLGARVFLAKVWLQILLP